MFMILSRKNQAAFRAAAVLHIIIFLGLTELLLAATPRHDSISTPVNPLIEPLPQAWGNPQLAPRPQPISKKPVISPTALVPLPPPLHLRRLPEGYIAIGEGLIEPQNVLRHSALYIIRAQKAGIVEYLYEHEGITQLGQPLVRIYDLSILNDLRLGESIMARFATSPFVIASAPQTGLPPVPPANFPQPTVIQQMLDGLWPPNKPTTNSLAQDAASSQMTLSQHKIRSGLAPRMGLAPATKEASRPSLAPAAEKAQILDVDDIKKTTAELSAVRERIRELNEAVAQLESQISLAQQELAAAREDVETRQHLFAQGVLARKMLEAAQKKAQELENEIHSLERKRSELTETREKALQRLALLQEEIEQQVARRQEAAALSEATPSRATQIQRPNGKKENENNTQTSSAVVPNAAQPIRAASAANGWEDRTKSAFPSPTLPAQPHLRNLPRSPAARTDTASSDFNSIPEIPTVPIEVKRLAAPRWIEQAAPTNGLVVRQLTPPGAQVQPGQPLLEIANRDFAPLYADVAAKYVDQFLRGAPVTITFDDYPGIQLAGWINDVKPAPNGLARVEMIVLAVEGYFAEDTFASLEWLALAAPLEEPQMPQIRPALETKPAAGEKQANIYRLMPLLPPEIGPAQDTILLAKKKEFVGLIHFGETKPAEAKACINNSHNDEAKRLAKLREWRKSFVEGMQTGLFGNLMLTYPREGEICQAVEKMATGRVSHEPNRCARTLREALGWGLGDAAEWLKRLPERGYRPRPDGLARPGDILVWPFTYGPRRTQHIGIAVSQNGKLMLLSNLNGVLGTSELVGGYVAFYKPKPQEKAMSQKGKPLATQQVHVQTMRRLPLYTNSAAP